MRVLFLLSLAAADELLQWFSRKGGELRGADVRYTVAEGRGLFTTKALAKGSVLVSFAILLAAVGMGVFGSRLTEKQDYHEEFIWGQTSVHNVLRRSAARILELTSGDHANPRAVLRYTELFRLFLDIHHRQEDDHIFPALQVHMGQEFMAREGEEHVEVAALLEALRKLTQADEADLRSVHALMQKLQGMLTDHLDREDAAMTPEVYRQFFSEAETRALSKAIHDMIGPTMNRGTSLVFLIFHLTAEEKLYFDERLPYIMQYVLFNAFTLKEDLEVWRLAPFVRIGLLGRATYTGSLAREG